MNSEASELPKGLVLGRDGNIHIRLTESSSLDDVGSYNAPTNAWALFQASREVYGCKWVLSPTALTLSFTLPPDPGYALLKAISLPQGMARDLCLELQLLVGWSHVSSPCFGVLDLSKSPLELEHSTSMVVLLWFGHANIAVALFGLLVGGHIWNLCRMRFIVSALLDLWIWQPDPSCVVAPLWSLPEGPIFPSYGVHFVVPLVYFSLV
ncbi:TMV resistance protein N-like [Pyrus ussuriensis x Pyrus communis]|uniref:TMV resistance protein N-like n=1 Tax=Pyrus ussuriensis x Pyrus communis TaxID=2448454 RepID=A0A5N5FQ92_9ROSA|nr:TMV resistance protein N-like [Pyrus ussuriensis x Pyrus communis]